jgi:hypothetical protein
VNVTVELYLRATVSSDFLINTVQCLDQLQSYQRTRDTCIAALAYPSCKALNQETRNSLLSNIIDSPQGERQDIWRVLSVLKPKLLFGLPLSEFLHKADVSLCNIIRG